MTTEAVVTLQGMTSASPAASAPDWRSVFSTIGTALPGDYVELISTMGGGRYDGYLWVLEPWCPNPHYDLIDAISERAEALQMLWDSGEAKPGAVASGAGRLIPWASTDNGEFCYWLASRDVYPDAWTVMVNEARGEGWEHYEMGCVNFLLGILSGRLRSQLLWSGFPQEVHEFRSSSTFA